MVGRAAVRVTGPPPGSRVISGARRVQAAAYSRYTRAAVSWNIDGCSSAQQQGGSGCAAPNRRRPGATRKYRRWMGRPSAFQALKQGVLNPFRRGVARLADTQAGLAYSRRAKRGRRARGADQQGGVAGPQLGATSLRGSGHWASGVSGPAGLSSSLPTMKNGTRRCRGGAPGRGFSADCGVSRPGQPGLGPPAPARPARARRPAW